MYMYVYWDLIYMWRLDELKLKWIFIFYIGRGWRFECDKKGLN